MQTVDIFDAKTQQIEPHTVRIDGNGEFVFESASGRFLKFPKDTNPDDFPALFEAHKEANIGQISLEEQEAKLATLMSRFATPAQQTAIPETEETPVEE